ncbi:hypothetical protein NFI99_23855 [Burkholderia glumae]|uniref:Phage ABA sandwich domain-containing protein n=1 Tax=Burkholderia glumae TaxID=337 RepID=A0ABY5BDS0_BURGL|nr:hypothetical protein [Burkholderia glumae]USS44665.1 hypothetical protein NFI99_23855 [Burkholderia glumae]
MTDKEPLELAAKAAGIEGTYVRVHQAYGDQWVEGIDTGAPVFWNPLTDDGDALRLAVKLEMDVCQFGDHVSVSYWVNNDDSACIVMRVGEGQDIYAATRRAITRAAAEIARTTDTGGEA